MQEVKSLLLASGKCIFIFMFLFCSIIIMIIKHDHSGFVPQRFLLTCLTHACLDEAILSFSRLPCGSGAASLLWLHALTQGTPRWTHCFEQMKTKSFLRCCFVLLRHPVSSPILPFSANQRGMSQAAAREQCKTTAGLLLRGNLMSSDAGLPFCA